MAKRPVLIREDISGKTPRFRFSRSTDGRRVYLGEIEYVYKRHVRQFCWEATGPDGHRGMHDREAQAIKALEWDGTGYPFPAKA